MRVKYLDDPTIHPSSPPFSWNPTRFPWYVVNGGWPTATMFILKSSPELWGVTVTVTHRYHHTDISMRDGDNMHLLACFSD